jgi:hypothetical protein
VNVTVIELDENAIEFEIRTDVGTQAVLADLYLIEDRLIYDMCHVTGEGLNVGIIRRIAKVLGEVEDVEEVTIQGGDRQSGANQGSSPSPIRVKVKR